MFKSEFKINPNNQRKCVMESCFMAKDAHTMCAVTPFILQGFIYDLLDSMLWLVNADRDFPSDMTMYSDPLN